MKGIVAVVVVLLTVASAFARPDLNAFLNRPAPTLLALIKQAKSDKQVMDRYCRHYGMTPAEVVKFLKTLGPSVIRKDGVYTIYSVPAGGALKQRLGKLTRGTRVYVAPDGTPELVALCGNPLRGRSKILPNEVEPDVVSVLREDLRDLPEPEFVAEILPPVAEDVPPILAEIPPEIPDEVVTQGESPIPISSLSPALLFPLTLFAATTSGSGGDVPGPAAVIPFAVGMWAVARRRRARS